MEQIYNELFCSFTQININFELEKLRIELRHLRGMYAVAHNEAMDASRKVMLPSKLKFCGEK